MKETQKDDLNGNQLTNEFEAILQECTNIKNEYVMKNLKWYKSTAPKNYWAFRITGILIILLSVSIPFLTSLNGYWKDIILPVASLSLAGLTGLNSFLRWRESWVEFRQTQYELEYQLTKWNIKILEAKYHPNKQEAQKMVTDATTKLIETTRQSLAKEAQSYFERIESSSTTSKT